MSTNQKLRAIAEQLPPLPKLKNEKVQYQKVNQRITGEKILQEDPEAKTKDGMPLLRHLWYQRAVRVPLLLDHFSTMKSIYKNSGADGVNKYIELAFQFNKIANPGIKFE